MSEFWSPVVATLEPYVPGEQPQEPGLTKLNTNENPYPPSPKVLSSLIGKAIQIGSSGSLCADPATRGVRVGSR